MSIVRVGLAETKNFSDGYDRIFGKKKDEATEQQAEATQQQDKAKEEKKEKK